MEAEYPLVARSPAPVAAFGLRTGGHPQLYPMTSGSHMYSHCSSPWPSVGEGASEAVRTCPIWAGACLAFCCQGDGMPPAEMIAQSSHMLRMPLGQGWPAICRCWVAHRTSLVVPQVQRGSKGREGPL